MTKRNPLIVVCLVLLVATLAGCASTSSSSSADPQGDAKISAAVQARLKEHRELDAPNSVYVQTRAGVVYLTGQVATDLQRDTAETVAGQTPGVVRVVNTIALTFGGR